MNKPNAIVTLVVGDKYKKLFNKYSRASFVKYSQKINADLIIIEERLDSSSVSNLRSIAWQKLLILSQNWSNNYEQILWIDSDVVINNTNADNIFDTTPIKKIGGVDAYKIPNTNDYQIGLKRLYEYWDKKGVNYIENFTPAQYYLKRGITTKIKLDQVLHTGVLVCSPKYHKDIFNKIYSMDSQINEASGNYEMPLTSAVLLEEDLVSWVDHEYNFCVNEIIASDFPDVIQSTNLFLKRYTKRVVREIFSRGKFIHFAGCTDKMKYLK